MRKSSIDFLLSLKDIRENLVILTLITYGIGLIYEVLFFNSFSVPIIYYCTLNDLLLFAISEFLPVLIVTLLYRFAMRWMASNLHEVSFFKKTRINTPEKILAVFTTISYVIMIILKLSNVYDFTHKDFLYFICPVTICMIESHSLIFKAFFISLIGVSFFLVIDARGDALKSIYITPENSHNSVVEFVDKTGEYISTNNYGIVYIGETSTTIFLYDLTRKSTYIYQKSEISNLLYVSPSAVTTHGNKFPIDIRDPSAPKIDGVFKYNKWLCDHKGVYSKFYLSTPKGLNKSLLDLRYYLKTCGLSFSKPSLDESFMTPETIRFDNIGLLDSLVNTEKVEILKYWAIKGCEIRYKVKKDTTVIIYDSLYKMRAIEKKYKFPRTNDPYKYGYH